jgi:hypothetical protein
VNAEVKAGGISNSQQRIVNAEVKAGGISNSQQRIVNAEVKKLLHFFWQWSLLIPCFAMPSRIGYSLFLVHYSLLAVGYSSGKQ